MIPFPANRNQRSQLLPANNKSSSEQTSNAPDFEVLGEAAGLVLQQLRRDEQVPELADQLKEAHAGAGAHRYFLQPYLSDWGTQSVHHGVIPLPPVLVDQFSNLECMSFMGLLPEINHAWLTIDNQLFLWRFAGEAAAAGEADFVHYDGLEQIIVSVGLATPRQGIFKDVVKYVLVVATPVEVILLGITFENDDLLGGSIRLRRTPFSLTTDNVNMVKIVGTKHGRIFMAGKDGCLYEMAYDSTNAGAVGAYLPMGRPKKCRKLNHSTSVVGSMVPGFLKSLGGLAQAQVDLVDVSVDDCRNILYTLSQAGNIDVYDLGHCGNEMYLVGARQNVFKCAKAMCEAAARSYQSAPEARLFQEGHGFRAVALAVVPPTESRSVHLIVISNAGFRFYFSTFRPHFRGYMGFQAGLGTQSSEAFKRPMGLYLLHVRPPPGPQLWDSLAEAYTRQQGGQDARGITASPLTGARVQAQDGFAPGYSKPSSAGFGGSLTSGSAGRPLTTVHAAAYCHGALLLAEKTEHQSDRLVAIGEDLMGRRAMTTGIWEGAEVQPALRESVCEVGPDSPGKRGLLALQAEGAPAASPVLAIPGRVWDIKESCPLLHNEPLAHTRALLVTSRTPPDNELHPGAARPAPSDLALKAAKEPLRVSAPAPPLALPFAGRDPAAGITGKDLAEITPLPELATQHMGLSRDFYCLTSSGIHIIRRLRPIDTLYRLLSNREASVSALDVFFRAFGREQACAMCFALACDLPDAAIGGLQMTAGSKDLRRTAVGAAFQFGGQASIKAPAYMTQDSSALATQGGGRGTVFGEEFSFSYHHNGLALLLSRILRPFWFKRPFVQEKAGGPVSVLFNPTELRLLRNPLDKFLGLMQEYYAGSVVRDCSGIHAHSQSRESGAQGGVVGRLLELYSSEHQGFQKVKEEEARKREERSLHKLYRLASRTVQALNLIDVLLQFQAMPTPVDFRPLAGRTTCDLVVSIQAHDAVQVVLSKLVHPATHGLGTDLCDQIAEALSKSCGFYFSEGDRLTYEGQKHLAAAANLQTGTQEQLIEEQKGLELLCKAAVYWRSAAAVSENGPLSAAVKMLAELKRPDGVVDVALACAQNFSHKAVSRSILLRSGVQEGGFGWEAGLYHGGALQTPEEKTQARTACYKMILEVLGQLLRPEARVGAGQVSTDGALVPLTDMLQLADSLLQRALGSKDPEFHNILYTFLLKHDEKRLVRIESLYIEEFLRANSVELLWRHFVLHDKHAQATRLMDVLAHADNSTSLEDRIRFLTRAISSAKQTGSTAATSTKAGAVFSSAQANSGEKLADLQEQLEVATLQRRVLEALESSIGYLRSKVDVFEGIEAEVAEREEGVAWLSKRLVTVSDLYNEQASRYRFWGLCLLILGTCSHYDRDLIHTLWRAIIYKEVPLESKDDQKNIWLRSQHESVDKDPYYKVDKSFEEDSWRETLKTNLATLGHELYNSQFSFTFPVPFLCDELETLAAEHNSIRGRPQGESWVIQLMLDVGVSFQVLFDTYSDLFYRSQSQLPAKQIQCLNSLCGILDSWTSKIDKQSASGTERQQFMAGCSSGDILRKCKDFKSSLQALHGHGVSEKDTEECVRVLRQVEDKINKFIDQS